MDTTIDPGAAAYALTREDDPTSPELATVARAAALLARKGAAYCAQARDAVLTQAVGLLVRARLDAQERELRQLVQEIEDAVRKGGDDQVKARVRQAEQLAALRRERPDLYADRGERQRLAENAAYEEIQRTRPWLVRHLGAPAGTGTGARSATRSSTISVELGGEDPKAWLIRAYEAHGVPGYEPSPVMIELARQRVGREGILRGLREDKMGRAPARRTKTTAKGGAR